ncbi:MAG: PhoX family protein [Acidimicrobiales bacterium]
MGIVDDDIISNDSGNETFGQVLDRAISRRGLLAGGLATGAAAFLAGVGGRPGVLGGPAPAQALLGRPPGRGPLLGFAGIAPSTADQVVVPPGYRANVVIAWGDPVSAGPAFAPDASNSAAEQAQQWGMHNDGLIYFGFPSGVSLGLPLIQLLLGGSQVSSTAGLIVMNHEYTDDGLLFPDGVEAWTAAKTDKSLAAHGVGIIEVRRTRGNWIVRRPSPFARRITGATPINITGPAAGHPLLRTSADPTGRRVLGTLNNCAMGRTPWHTFLACEENFNGYFRRMGTPTALERRYGINAAGFGYLWHTTHPRFLADSEPNEAHRFGCPNGWTSGRPAKRCT